MSKLNHELLSLVKSAFVPMPGGQAEPVAGASPATAAMGNPVGGQGGEMPMDPAMMDPAMAGMDPAMMDPAAGGAPMDPAAGGMPMDPAMMEAMMGAAGGEPGGAPEGALTLTVDQLIQLFQAFSGANGATAKKPKENGTDAKLDQIITLLSGQQPQAPQPQ